MAGIQASTGLISGVPIQDTVDKLLAVSAQPRDRLQKQTTGLQNQQLAVNQLTALVIGVQLSTDQLGKQTLFTQNKVQSSSDAIAATASSDAKAGRYSFVPFRQAQQQQFTSSSLASSDQLVGAGEIKIHAGGFLDASMALDNLNGGTGVARGQIRITDRSGASTVIDLRTSQSARDVIDAINSQSNVRVTAKLSGDRFQLTDSSGGSGTLTVSEVNSGVTARDLGLANIAAAANTASGSDVVSISRSTALRSLRDGLGVRLASSSNNSLSITLRDGSTVNFKTSLSANSGSVGQLIDAINAAGGGKFQASINATGNGLQLQDLTSGAGTFTVTSPSGNLAKDLGWDQPAVGGTTLSGQRVQSGLGDVLLSSLGGGAGLSTLGGLTLRDRSGATATVNLNSAETIGDVIDSINAAGLGINARLNDTRTGITLIDTSGSTSTTLAATNADATNTATKLGLGTSTDPAKIAGASLERQWIHENTLLSQWNQGRGLTLNSIKFTNSAGQQSAVNLSQSSPKTVGDMLNAINAVAQGFEARINETGDGILLVDTAGGSGSLTVTDVGSGTTAKQLRIAGSSQSMTVGNATVKGINGSLDMTISTTSTTTVAELVTKLNESGSAVQASLLNLGTSGVRLAITSGASGVAGRLAVDSSSLSVAFSETAQAQDALLSVGGNGTTGGVLLSSSSNSFTGVAEGLDITINNASTSQVTVDITANNDAVTKQMSSMVDQFNKLRDKLGELTAFDPAKYTTGLLFGSTEALRVDLAFGQLFAGKVSGAGSIRSIAELGISFNDKGKLEFNRQRFQAVMDRDPAAVKEFFTNTERGFSTKAKSVADSLSGTKGGALLQRTQTLQAKIDINNKRIESINKRLDAERTRLLNQFYGMESAISKIQANLSSINKIAPLST